jgi:hypothetical protein
LHGFYDEESIFRALLAATHSCGRRVPEREIKDAIAFTRTNAYQPPDGRQKKHSSSTIVSTPRTPKWPTPDLDAIDRIVTNGVGLYDLWECSPVRLDSPHPEAIIDTLFPGNPLLCVGAKKFQFSTLRREVWRTRLHKKAFIVPSPMLERFGKTREGKRSEHTLEQTAERVYLVVEFDFSEYARDGVQETIFAPLVRSWRTQGIEIADACAALHLFLANDLPLVLVVHSGGKSLHGWYAAHNQEPEALRLFFRSAVELGPDPATWCPSQFVRLPDGRRENGKAQTRYYLDPQFAVQLTPYEKSVLRQKKTISR